MAVIISLNINMLYTVASFHGSTLKVIARNQVTKHGCKMVSYRNLGCRNLGMQETRLQETRLQETRLQETRWPKN